jgi:hypothetical protein
VTNWNADTGQNVVWRSPMPAPSFAQPLVVGEKVFTMADPHILLCVNARSGAILWQTEVDHTAVMEPGKREKARSERRFIFDTRREFGKWWETQLAFEQKLKEKKITVEAIKIVRNRSRTGWHEGRCGLIGEVCLEGCAEKLEDGTALRFTGADGCRSGSYNLPEMPERFLTSLFHLVNDDARGQTVQAS